MGFSDTNNSDAFAVRSPFIALELPDGTFEAVALPEGGMRIQLSWNQAFNLDKLSFSLKIE